MALMHITFSHGKLPEQISNKMLACKITFLLCAAAMLPLALVYSYPNLITGLFLHLPSALFTFISGFFIQPYLFLLLNFIIITIAITSPTQMERKNEHLINHLRKEGEIIKRSADLNDQHRRICNRSRDEQAEKKEDRRRTRSSGSTSMFFSAEKLCLEPDIEEQTTEDVRLVYGLQQGTDVKCSEDFCARETRKCSRGRDEQTRKTNDAEGEQIELWKRRTRSLSSSSPLHTVKELYSESDNERTLRDARLLGGFNYSQAFCAQERRICDKGKDKGRKKADSAEADQKMKAWRIPPPPPPPPPPPAMEELCVVHLNTEDQTVGPTQQHQGPIVTSELEKKRLQKMTTWNSSRSKIPAPRGLLQKAKTFHVHELEEASSSARPACFEDSKAEESLMSVDELNLRVEAFIAKFSKQIRLERHA